MGISHTYRSKRKLPSFYTHFSNSFFYWDFFSIENRRSHINSYIFPVSSEDNHTFCCFYTDLIFFCESFFSYILEKAPSTISTHFYFGSILIIDSISKVCFFRFFDNEYLVASNSKMSVSKTFCDIFRYSYVWIIDSIEYYKIISESVHFCERNSHRKYIRIKIQIFRFSRALVFQPVFLFLRCFHLLSGGVLMPLGSYYIREYSYSNNTTQLIL